MQLDVFGKPMPESLKQYLVKTLMDGMKIAREIPLETEMYLGDFNLNANQYKMYDEAFQAFPKVKDFIHDECR